MFDSGSFKVAGQNPLQNYTINDYDNSFDINFLLKEKLIFQTPFKKYDSRG